MVPVIIPWLPLPERSFISPSAVRFSMSKRKAGPSDVGKLARLATSDAFRARLYNRTSSMVPLKKFLDSLPEVPILTLFERIVVAGARAEHTSTQSRYPLPFVPLKVAQR